MTKKQKIWFGVFLAMFLVPEILWSPVGNVVYELFQSGNSNSLRSNFLTGYQHNSIYQSILIFQTVGLMLSIYYLKKNVLKKLVKYCLIVFLIILLILTLAVLYLSFAVKNLGF